jgi:hypothetical protein
LGADDFGLANAAEFLYLFDIQQHNFVPMLSTGVFYGQFN